MEYERIVITGGLGFLGQHLVHALLEKYPDADITILARSRRNFFIRDFSTLSNVSIVYNTDLADQATIAKYFIGAQLVFHAAAMISFWRKDRNRLYRSNVEGTRTVVELCRDNAVEKLIYVSSTAALGFNDLADSPADETFLFNWKKARKYAYMQSKYLAEKVVWDAVRDGLPAVIANPSTIYGYGDEKVFPLVNNILNGRMAACLPGGFAVIDVRDAAAGLVRLMEKGKTGEQYLMTGGNYTYRQVLTALAGSLGADPPVKTLSRCMGRLLVPVISLAETLLPKPLPITTEILAPGFAYRYYSIEKIKRDTGWAPGFALDKTFQAVADYYNRKQMEET